MKSNIKIKLLEAVYPNVVYWQAVLVNKLLALAHSYVAIDRSFEKFQLSVWVTQEYRSAGRE